MSDSTSILDLPTDPVGGGSMGGNVTIKAHEPVQSQMRQSEKQSSALEMTLDQTTISQIVNGLQQASLVGATQLPSRDIPMNSTDLSVDPQVMPNYVPQAPREHVDYIKNYEQSSEMINNNIKTNNSLDDMYNEIQTPLLLAILYFLFQLPFFKKFLYDYLPFLFSIDGNYNLNGFIFISVAFGILFHFLMKTTCYFNAF